MRCSGRDGGVWAGTVQLLVSLYTHWWQYTLITNSSHDDRRKHTQTILHRTYHTSYSGNSSTPIYRGKTQTRLHLPPLGCTTLGRVQCCDDLNGRQSSSTTRSDSIAYLRF